MLHLWSESPISLKGTQPLRKILLFLFTFLFVWPRPDRPRKSPRTGWTERSRDLGPVENTYKSSQLSEGHLCTITAYTQREAGGQPRRDRRYG